MKSASDMATELLRLERERSESLRRWLAGLPASTLVGWLMETANRDASLWVVLRCEQAQEAAGGLDLGAFREAIEHFTGNFPHSISAPARSPLPIRSRWPTVGSSFDVDPTWVGTITFPGTTVSFSGPPALRRWDDSSPRGWPRPGRERAVGVVMTSSWNV